MKLFRFCNKRISFYQQSLPTLFHIHKYKLCSVTTDKKSLEFSDDTNENPLLQSISESEAYQTILSDDKTSKFLRTQQIAFRKQNLSYDDSDKNRTGSYAKLWNVSSADELRKVLNEYKNNYDPTKRIRIRSGIKSKNQNILNILNDIADNPDKSDNSEISDQNQTTLSDSFYLPDAYSRAIKICVYLREYNEGFKIFEEAKSEPDLCLSPSVFASAIALKMANNYDINSLNECFDIIDDMINNYRLKPSMICYRELLTHSVNLRCWNKAKQIVDDIYNMDEKRKRKLLNGASCRPLRVSIVNYFARTRQIEKGLEFMNFLSKNYGSSTLDQGIYTSILTGIALVVLDGDKSMIEVAEKLFQQSMELLGSTSPDEPVFTALINVYASGTDINSCMDILKAMIDNPDWPTPTGYSYSSALKALSKYGVGSSKDKQFEYKEGWKIVDEILGLMKTHNVIATSPTYSTLFNLCAGAFCGKSDIKKLYKYYDKMIKSGIKVEPSSLNSLLMSGIDHYALEIQNHPKKKDNLTKDLKTFIEWGILQFQQNGIKLPKRVESRLQQKLTEINC